jgi:hypothetical protein
VHINRYLTSSQTTPDTGLQILDSKTEKLLPRVMSLLLNGTEFLEPVWLPARLMSYT